MKPGFWTRFTKQRNGRVRNIVYQVNRRKLRAIQPKIAASWQWITNSEASLAEVFGKGLQERFGKMLVEGQIGVYAMYEGRPVAYAWAIINKGTAPSFPNDVVCLESAEAYIHFCYTQEQFRGKGLYPWLLSILAAELFSSFQVQRVLIDVEDQNAASKRGIMKAGFSRRRTATRFLFLGKQVALTFEEVA